jgi:hypothetical protein
VLELLNAHRRERVRSFRPINVEPEKEKLDRGLEWSAYAETSAVDGHVKLDVVER